MSGHFRSGLHSTLHTIAKHTKRTATFTKLTIISALFVSASFVPIVTFKGTAHAEVNCSYPNSSDSVWVNGSSWLNGGGVNVCSADEGSVNVCVPVSGAPASSYCSAGNVWSGTQWQCVEFINRLYLTKGWTTTTWYGNADTLINDVSNHPGLSTQSDGSISYLNPGDVVTATVAGGDGHAWAISAIGSSITLISQNTDNQTDATTSAHIASGTSLSASNADIDFTGWAGYEAQAVVHHQSGSTSSSAIVPQSISYSGNLNLFTTGGDGQVYTQYWNGSSWSGYASIGGSMLSNPALIVNGSGLDVFARDVDNQVYTKYWDGSSWSGWSSLGSTTMQGNPTVIHYGSTEIDVFALGTDGHTYKDTYNGSSWGGWSSLGNTMAGSPSAIQYGSEMDVIIRGTDNAVYKDTWNGSTWTGFSSLGGTIIGDPSAMSYSTYGEYDIWVDTSGGDIFRKTWTGSAWSGWTDYGGTFTGNPYAVQYNNDMYVFARAKGDNTIWKKYWSYSGGSWHGWDQLGTTTMAGDPSAYQYGSSELDTFVTGSDTKSLFGNL